MVEQRQLLAEEQGAFRKGRGCRAQVLTLMLLGQMKAVAKKGMFAAFIDLKKAYDRVDRASCGGVWKVWALVGGLWPFCGQLTGT